MPNLSLLLRPIPLIATAALLAAALAYPSTTALASLSADQPPPETAKPAKPDPAVTSKPDDAAKPSDAASADAQEIVVYCSVDPRTAEAVFKGFTAWTKVKVRPIFPSDTTPSMAERLRADRKAGTSAADAWWSDDPLTTIELANEGAFRAYRSESGDKQAGDVWPHELRDGANADPEVPRWYALGRRLRVVAYNLAKVRPEELPSDLQGLSAERWRGRVGIAAPTTGGGGPLVQLAAMHALDDGKTLRSWLTAMAASGLRVLDTDDAVAGAIARGELDVGICGSDSAARVAGGGLIRFRVLTAAGILRQPGTLEHSTFHVEARNFQVPHVIALIAQAKHPENAELLLDYLISNQVAEILVRPPSFSLGPYEQVQNEMTGVCDGTAVARRPVRFDVKLEGLHLPTLAVHAASAKVLWDELKLGEPQK